MEFEISILNWLQTLHTPFLDQFMIVVSTIGNGGMVWIIIALLLLLNKNWRKYGVMMGLSLILCLFIGNLTLKPLVARIRPYEVGGFTNLLIAAPHDYSFPSGHTMSSFAAASVLFFMNRKFGIVAWCLAISIAFSRMYLYVHFPSDILAGGIIGISIAWIAIRITNMWWKSHRIGGNNV
ncbi:MAG: phosphatase PAP2 family protein [Lachnospiraceae bacterium]